MLCTLLRSVSGGDYNNLELDSASFKTIKSQNNLPTYLKLTSCEVKKWNLRNQTLFSINLKPEQLFYNSVKICDILRPVFSPSVYEICFIPEGVRCVGGSPKTSQDQLNV